VIGTIDDHNRALIDMHVRRSPNSPATTITTWIDTAFDGHLVCSRSLIDALNLDGGGSTQLHLQAGGMTLNVGGATEVADALVVRSTPAPLHRR